MYKGAFYRYKDQVFSLEINSFNGKMYLDNDYGCVSFDEVNPKELEEVSYEEAMKWYEDSDKEE